MMIHHKDFAKRTGYSPDHIRKLIREGKIPAVVMPVKGKRESYYVDDSLIPSHKKKATENVLPKSGKHAVKKRKVHSTALDKAVAECEEYNQKHGTSLSYGQYMSLKAAK